MKSDPNLEVGMSYSEAAEVQLTHTAQEQL